MPSRIIWSYIESVIQKEVQSAVKTDLRSLPLYTPSLGIWPKRKLLEAHITGRRVLERFRRENYDVYIFIKE